MPRCLFKVEDTFLIAGRGLVPIPGIIPIGDERFRVGDPILLKRPNGSTISTNIGGLEFCCPHLRNDVVILLRGLTKADIPIGTEIWSAAVSECRD